MSGMGSNDIKYKRQLINSIEKYVLAQNFEEGIVLEKEIDLVFEEEEINDSKLKGVFNIVGEALVEDNKKMLYGLDELTLQTLEMIVYYQNAKSKNLNELI